MKLACYDAIFIAEQLLNVAIGDFLIEEEMTDHENGEKAEIRSHPDSRYLTRKLAARYTNVSEATLAKLASVGGGPAFFKRGRRPYYMRDELDRWMQESGPRRSTADGGT